MAVSAFKTWIAGEVLTASDLNNSFSQVFNNGEDLGFPRTKDADFNGNALILDTDADSELVEISDDIIGLQLTGVAGIIKFDGATAGGALTNGFTFEVQDTGNAVRIIAQGTDTDISIALVPKGTGTVTGVTFDLVNDVTPQLGAQLDVNGFALGTGTLELLDFVETASAVNEVTITNAATGNAPRLSATGDDTDIDFAFVAKGTGDFTILDPADLTSVWKFDPSPIATATTRIVTMVDANVDLADVNTSYQQGKETIWIPAAAMTPTVSNGSATLTSVETTAGRPDLIVLDFDKDADERAQFQVAFPKKWNLGTVTFQAFWTQSVGAVTDGVAWGLVAVAVSDNETIDVAYGLPKIVTDDAQGAVEELYVTVESTVLTIAGTPADDDMVFFRIFRDVSDGNDDLAGDARLIGIKLFFTTDANDDT